ncbi:MAG: hypothetical protein J7L39_04215 [Candidatus Aenigmarchaeota archaeon]|nr:hypothetical protein [Candidatus Aenigmarchaeota archaeon]
MHSNNERKTEVNLESISEEKFYENFEKEKIRSDLPLFVKIERYTEILENIQEIAKKIGKFKRIIKEIEELENRRRELFESFLNELKTAEEKISELTHLFVKGTPPEKRAKEEEKKTLVKMLEELEAEVEGLKKDIEGTNL